MQTRMDCRDALRFDIRQMTHTFFITGTDTGVGKTVFTTLMTEFLRSRKIRVAALKPVCSGGRGDARRLHRALGGALTLDEINPWYFRAPLAPVVAARQEHKTVLRHAALKHIRAIRRNFDVVLIEGAGGLLSPLGVDFNARDLMRALAATPVIVAANRLGVVNQLLLTLEALPRNLQSRARVVLMAPPKPTLAAAFNAGMLKRLARQPVHIIPWLGRKIGPETIHGMPQLQRSLGAISAGVQATD